jgi:NADPH:quinone reductase-like Zn-dependent oxidoreductase
VNRFKSGDKVATLFNQAHIAGSLDAYSAGTGVGGVVDGTFQQFGAFDEQGLVKIPNNLSMLEAGTLTCAAVTAWNALYGLESRALKQGDHVLTQGTGGVSIFALQFAKAAGAIVVATTSSPEKMEALKKYGADFVINYKEDTKWGETAKAHTPGGEGFSHIIEVGGPSTMKQVRNHEYLATFISKARPVPLCDQDRWRNLSDRLLRRHKTRRTAKHPRGLNQCLHGPWRACGLTITI